MDFTSKAAKKGKPENFSHGQNLKSLLVRYHEFVINQPREDVDIKRLYIT